MAFAVAGSSGDVACWLCLVKKQQRHCPRIRLFRLRFLQSVVLASLLVSATVLGAAWLPPAELPATTTCKSDLQAIATTDRHARTTVDDSLGATLYYAVDSTDGETIDNAIDSTGDETIDDAIDPTGDETIDNAIDWTDDEAANKTELPDSGCGAAAQYEQACAQALSKA